MQFTMYALGVFPVNLSMMLQIILLTISVLLSMKNRKASAGLFHESFFGIIPFGERLDCRRYGGDDDNHLPEDFP